VLEVLPPISNLWWRHCQ